MQDAVRVNTKPKDDVLSDDELIDTLIAISVVAKILAEKFRKIKVEGDKQNGSQE